MADADLEEYKRLEAVIADVEKLVTASPQGASPLLLTFVENARKQLESLDRKIKEKERTAEQEQQTAIQVAVDRETALNASEKEAYSGFLKEDFFTKADFSRLETFYDKSYDKLTDSGKEEMSYRVWEGIRRNGYTFGELPENAQEKESKKLYLQLTGKTEADPNLQNIPEQDKEDFEKGYNSGDKKEVARVLGRKSFSNNVSTHKPESLPDTAPSRDLNSSGNIDTMKEKPKPVVSQNQVDADLAAFNDDQPSISPVALPQSADKPGRSI